MFACLSGPDKQANIEFSPEHKSKTNDPKVFKLDILQVSQFWFERSKVNVRVSVHSGLG